MNVLVVLIVAVAMSTAALATSNLAITPDSFNRTVFEQQLFKRVCRYNGPRSDIEELQMLHNGTVRMSVSSSDSVQLEIAQTVLSDAGHYECRVTFTNGEVEGPVSMGHLTVLGAGLLNVPPNQYVVEGHNITLQCSFTGSMMMYGTTITSVRRGDDTFDVIRNASLEDEGEYSCEVTLLDADSSISMPFTLHVFTPINITARPPPSQEILGVQRANFSVTFTGRATQDITITWRLEGNRFESSEHTQLETIFPDSRHGVASIIFPAIARQHSGVYNVEIRTEFGAEVIDPELRMQTVGFQLRVKVRPPAPSNFQKTDATEHSVTLQWNLSPNDRPLHPDEVADRIIVYLQFPNGSPAGHTELEGTATQVVLDAFPGMQYRAIVVAENQDGFGPQSDLDFTTPNAAPYISYFESRRLNETHFNMSISLLYTGGGSIRMFSVCFRESSTRSLTLREWVNISGLNLTQVSDLGWNGIISGEEFRGKGPLEFQLTVENDHGFSNISSPVAETSDPPGIPTIPTVKDPSPTSVVIDFNLPAEGTPPFIEVVIDFTEPSNFVKNFSGFYQPGQKFRKELNELSPQTAYSLKARAVNYAGDGPDSEIITFTTADEPVPSPEQPSSSSSPVWLLPAIAGGSALATVTVLAVLICCLVCCYCHWRRRNINVYRLGKDSLPRSPDAERTVQELEPEHEMLQRKDKVPVILATPPSSTKPSPEKSSSSSTNTYTQMPLKRGEERAPSTASSSPWNHKRQLENNRGSWSTLNSGSVAQHSQDSFIKKPDIISTGSLSLQSSQQDMQSYRTSRDSLMHKRKIPNPSISSGGSGSTEMTERYQTQSTVLSAPAEEVGNKREYRMASGPNECSGATYIDV